MKLEEQLHKRRMDELKIMKDDLAATTTPTAPLLPLPAPSRGVRDREIAHDGVQDGGAASPYKKKKSEQKKKKKSELSPALRLCRYHTGKGISLPV